MEPSYKANRKETPADLVQQFPIVEEALRAFGICCPRISGYEADDLLATYAKMASEAGHEVMIVSPDKDMLQLVSDQVKVMSASNSAKLDVHSVSKKFGVLPEQVPHLQALIGDAVDNIPKVSGLTESAAKNLILHFGSIHEALSRVEEITVMVHRDALRLNADSIRRSFELAKLKDDAPVPPLSELAFSGIHQKSSLAFCSKYKLKSIGTTLEKDWFSNSVAAQGAATASATSSPTVNKRSTLIVEGKEPLDAQGFIKTTPGRQKRSTSSASNLAPSFAANTSDMPPIASPDPLESMPFDEPVVTTKSSPSRASSASSSSTPKIVTATSAVRNGKDRLKRIVEEAVSKPKSESYEQAAARDMESYAEDANDFLGVPHSMATFLPPSLSPSSSSLSYTPSTPSRDPSATEETQQLQAVSVSPPPIPRARKRRSSTSDSNLTLLTEGHVSEEVDIDTDPTVVASTQIYKETRKRRSSTSSSPPSPPSEDSNSASLLSPPPPPSPSIAPDSSEQSNSATTTSSSSTSPSSPSSSLAPLRSVVASTSGATSSSTMIVSPPIVPSPPHSVSYSTSSSSSSSSPSSSSSKMEHAAKSFLESLKQSSPNPESIDQALANPGSLFSSATRKTNRAMRTNPKATITSPGAENDDASSSAAIPSSSSQSDDPSASYSGTVDGSSASATKKRGRKPQMVEVPLESESPTSSSSATVATSSSSAVSGLRSSTTPTATSPSTPASKRKNPANGPGTKTAAAASRTSSSSSASDDVEEDDEESNLELVDFIKNRAIEIDVEFVNLFKHCSTPVERRRVIESKLKGVTVANDEESARRVISKLMSLQDRFHACDSEVVDLNLKKQGPVGHGRIICASIYVGPDVDFGNGPRVWIDNLDDDSTLQFFKDYFESEKTLKVWHNYGFDRHVFFNHGIDVKGFGGDTMHMARLWDSSRRGAKAYSLEVLSRDLLLTGPEKDPSVVAKTSMKQRFGRVKLKKDGTPSKSAVVLPALDDIQRDAEWLPEWIDYATLDAEDTWRLREVLAAKLSAMNWTGKQHMFDFYREMWLPFGELLTDMERLGIKVDREYLKDLVPRALKEKAEGEKRFVDWAVEYVGPELRFMNPGSDAQKQQLLFAPCSNKIDPSKSMPATREFETENTEGYIEEGKKVAKKKRTFVITGLGLPFVDATDSGWPAVSHPVLAKLVGDPPEKYGPLMRMFEEKGLKGGKQACEALSSAVESSKVDTLISTFMIPLSEFADAKSRIHGSLNINTETGRLSSRRPNLQNQPAHEKDRFGIRKAFTCEPGNNLIVADYGQLELRLLAHMTNCKSMIEAFRSGGDFHSRTALGMYSHVKKAIDEGKVLLEWDSSKGKAPLPLLKDEFGTERRRAKTLNFSIAYGKTVMGLAKDWSVSPEEARETLDKWYADRPEVKQWQEKTIARAHVTGWTRTLLGRYRPLPEINSRDRMRRAHSERAAINTPLQGGAADITTRAMILLHRHERLNQLGWHQLLQIHDELILEGPEESTEEALSIVTHVMSHPLPEPLLIDLIVDAKAAKTWYEAK